MNIYTKFLVCLSLIFQLSTQSLVASEEKELLFYVGITMVRPVQELAKNFEQANNCKIKILQGGSKDLYESIAFSKKGDLYLPGSVSFRKKYMKDGILLDGAFVGWNKASLVVKKGNPKNIPADINVLINPAYRVVLGDAQSGSVGKETEIILKKIGKYESAIKNSVYLAPDSRNLTSAIKDGKADVVLSWYATTFWEDNALYVEPLVLSEEIASKQMLVLNLLKTSEYPELTKKFMKYAASKEGREVFYKYGFLDKEDLKNFDTVRFE